VPVKHAFGLRCFVGRIVVVGMLRAKGRREAGDGCRDEACGTIQAWKWSRRFARIAYEE
jgi:hypothetical protein